MELQPTDPNEPRGQFRVCRNCFYGGSKEEQPRWATGAEVKEQAVLAFSTLFPSLDESDIIGAMDVINEPHQVEKYLREKHGLQDIAGDFDSAAALVARVTGGAGATYAVKVNAAVFALQGQGATLKLAADAGGRAVLIGELVAGTEILAEGALKSADGARPQPQRAQAERRG